MKKILYFVLCLLLVVGIGGSAVLLTKNINSSTQIENSSGDSVQGDSIDDGTSSGDGNTSDDSSSTQTPDSGNTDGGSTGNDSGDGGNEEEDITLKDPVNMSSYIADGLEMMSGASIYIGEEEYGAAIRFTCNVSAEVKAAVDADENKSLAFLIAPLDYFDGVNANNYTYMDWVTAFSEAEKTVIYSPLEEGNFIENGDDYVVRFRLQNIFYKNVNRKFVCMLVLATASGDTTSYQYSAYPTGVDYRSNARSVSYVAAAALNANTLGLETFSEEDLARLKGYINQSVDLANGLEEATDDGSTYAFTISPSAPQSIAVGETFMVNAEIIPDVEIPIWYRSTDESVVTVDENGNVKALKAGTAVIGVYIAGEAYGITVTVS